MEFTLRRAVKADEARIGELFIEMLRTIYNRDDVTGHADGAVDYYFAGGDDWICVADMDGEIVGFLSMEVHREDMEYIYLDDFCVDVKYRGMGVGSRLLTAAEEYANKLNIDTIALHVEKENVAAMRLYERRGYTLFRDDGSRICMTKTIGGTEYV